MEVQQVLHTPGYADPLYIKTGIIKETSEVYSMGMVLLEVLTGKPPATRTPDGLGLDYTFAHLSRDVRLLQDMVDRRGLWPPAIVEGVGGLACACIDTYEARRPTFMQIVSALRLIRRGEQAPPVCHAVAKRQREEQAQPAQPAQPAKKPRVREEQAQPAQPAQQAQPAQPA